MIGWMTDLDEANSYFKTNRPEREAWEAISDDEKHEAFLYYAYNRIYYSGYYPLIPASPSAAQLIKLKMAQCEFAYYLAQHLADEDRRKGIQAQGVVSAGIVKEDYSESMIAMMPIPPYVDALLSEFKDEAALAIMDIDRDEDEEADSDVVDL